MSEFFCPSCSKKHLSNDRYCSFCGYDLEQLILEYKDRHLPVKLNNHKEEKTTTFFCPKCKHENTLGELFCVSCNEDFSKYNISGSVQDAIIKKRVERDVANAYCAILDLFCCY